MLLKKTLCLPIFLLVLLFSCEDKSEDQPITEKKDLEKNEKVNQWILEKMQTYYLWNDKLPASSGLNFKSDPYDFFASLKSSNDRFSRMEGTHISVPKSTLADDTSHDIGFEFFPGRYTDTGNYFLIIGYIKPNTNAEKIGLKRGLVIEKVDGNNITSENWFSALYQGKSSYKIDTRDLFSGATKKNIDLSVTPSYKENPVYLDSIYTINNRKVGYLVYNSFEAGGEAQLPYDVEIAQALTRFKNEGVRDLIVDFRYNLGGLVRCAQFITSALVPKRDTKNIFEIKSYNSKIQQGLEALPNTDPSKISMLYEFFVDNVQNPNGVTLYPIPRLGDQLDNVYFIVSSNTASSSEMVINTLKPYMKENARKVVLVGTKTVGKNVGSFALYEKNDPDNTYVLWPIVFQSYNKNKESNYSNGFTPDITINEFQYLDKTGWKEIGDTKEIMLATALDNLLGTQYSKTRMAESSIIPFTIEGSSLDRKSNKGMQAIPKSNDLKKLATINSEN